MTAQWLEAFPGTAKPFLEETDEILGCSLSRIIAEGPNSKLDASTNAQPAIMATSVMIMRILESEFSFKTKQEIDVTLGHSLGEYAALISSGHLEYKDALKMVRGRAAIMEECSMKAKEETGDRYGMVALVCVPERLENLVTSIHEFLGYGSDGVKDDSSHVPAIEQVQIANINSSNQIVLSGSLPRIRQLLIQIKEFGGHDPRAVEIKSDSPFHNPIMMPAKDYMRRALAKTNIRFPGDMPCVSNVSGRPFGSKHDLIEKLSGQAINTVRWWDSIKYLHQEAGVRRWLGVGPGKVGRNLVGKEVGRVQSKTGGVWAITDPKEVETTLQDFLDKAAAG